MEYEGGGKMKNKKLSRAALFLLVTFFLFPQPSKDIDQSLWKKALKIHRETIVIDSHCDTPMVMIRGDLDISKKSSQNDLDLIRMKEGGVDAAFFAVFVSNKFDKQQPSKKALEMIDEILNQIERNPHLAEMAYSSQNIINIHKTGKRAILMGMENGGPIEGSLRLLRNFYRLGIRYITLTHWNNNDICDASTQEKKRWNGLSPFGKEVVKEMNRLGMIIDVSHISDQSFWDVLKISRAPVFASHSCVRSLCDTPRNMSDEMIKALAKKRGVIQINFYSGFLDPIYKQKAKEAEKKIAPEREKIREKYGDDTSQYWNEMIKVWKKFAPAPPKIEVLINHIDYVVKLVGSDHVGLGSDFDGAGSFPKGLEDVSGYPLITYHLLKRGYNEEDIKKILGGNFLRLFKEVENTKKIITEHVKKP